MSSPAGISATAFINRFKQIRNQTELLCQPLTAEDTVMQPMVDVSPPKWHLAHTTWFFETFILQPNKPEYQLFHPKYNFLFNSYYNSIGSRVMRNQRGTLSRPALSEVYAYRTYVNEQITEFLENATQIVLAEIAEVFELGLQHEQQHQELLLTDIKFILSTNPLLPAYQQKQGKTVPETVKKAEFLPVPGGVYEIGYTGNDFCFDNEKGVHKVYVEDFNIRNKLVTNREFLEFMEAGGYTDFRYWLGEGFELAQQQQWEAPLYWFKTETNWQYFTLNGLQEIDWEAPVCHVSFYEAEAYANWAGCRLLTEAEWEIAAQIHPCEPANGNFSESENYQPVPEENQGLQLFGNVWEWTYSAYHPYPGYSKAPGALGEYNGKFMINQLVLRGGSCATPASHIRATYRNFFHPDKRWQFTGIRLAK